MTANCDLQIITKKKFFGNPSQFITGDHVHDNHLLVITKLNFVTAIPSTSCRTFLTIDPHQIDITSWRLQPVFCRKRWMWKRQPLVITCALFLKFYTPKTFNHFFCSGTCFDVRNHSDRWTTSSFFYAAMFDLINGSNTIL